MFLEELKYAIRMKDPALIQILLDYFMISSSYELEETYHLLLRVDNSLINPTILASKETYVREMLAFLGREDTYFSLLALPAQNLVEEFLR